MSQEEKVVFSNAKFGEVEVERDNVVEFPNGVPGFERCKRYGLLALDEEAPFLRLLSMDDPNVGFVLMNPMQVWGDYNPDIGREDLESLELAGPDELAVYCIVTLSSEPSQVTANLKGPIFINTRSMTARQMILMDERYHTKHSILGDGQEGA